MEAKSSPENLRFGPLQRSLGSWPTSLPREEVGKSGRARLSQVADKEQEVGKSGRARLSQVPDKQQALPPDVLDMPNRTAPGKG